MKSPNGVLLASIGSFFLFFGTFTTMNASAATGNPGIGNIQVDGQYPTIFNSSVTPIPVSHETSATITWTTNNAATTQVLLYGKNAGDCAQNGAAQLFPFHPSTALTTTHSVNVTGLFPNSAACFRVISGDGTGAAWTSPSILSGVLGFQTATVNTRAPKLFRLFAECGK